jgi:hypothetical protein
MAAAPRQECATKNCFATFEASTARDAEVRHCNRSGPDGGHPNRWDGQRWQVVEGQWQHDRA